MADWKLGHFCDIVSPVSRPVPKPREPYWRLGLRSFSRGTFHEFVEDPSTVDMDELYRVEKNDLIVNITFAWEHAIAVAQEDDAGLLVSFRFPTYVFSSIADPDFYKYVIAQRWVREQLDLISPGGAGRNRVMNKKQFLKIPCPIPPLSEQKRIAEILGCCDKVIRLKRELLEEKKKQKKALMQKLLNPDSGFRLPGFEGDWKSVKLENCGVWTGGGTPAKNNPEFWKNGTIKWISSQEVKVRILTETTYKITAKAIQASASNIIPENSLIFVTRSGVLQHSFPVAKIIEPMAINQDIKALIPNDTYCVDFLHFYLENLESDIIRNYVKSGTTVESLMFDQFKKMRIKIPQQEEQKAVVKILSVADDEVNLLEQELLQWEQKKKSLMQLLLTGKVRVNA